MGRALASVQRIKDLNPIENADNIELATVNGWKCVVRKGEFKVGDLCVYFEIDSILPVTLWSEFMASRKYHVRTIKLRGQISQGLALPLKTVELPPELSHVGMDATLYLGVKKYDTEHTCLPTCSRKKRPWWSYLPFGYKLYRYFFPLKGSWPEWVPKTDEVRMQNMSEQELNNFTKNSYCTEKLDGQSLTYYFNRKIRNGFLKKGVAGVCSRNVHYINWEHEHNNWCDYVRAHNMLEDLERYCRFAGRSLAVQGELIGPRIQGNVYGLCTRDFYIFSIYDIERQQYLCLNEKLNVLNLLGQKHVPWIKVDHKWEPGENPADYWYDLSQSYSLIPDSDTPREGIVVRNKSNDSESFKVINNEYLLKYQK